jgi:ABC-2 type transport system ATP-binding protein
LLGYLSDQFGLYENLSVGQSLIYMAVAQRVPPEDSEARVAETAAQLGLTDRLNQKMGELSRGFRQRVAIAQAIIHKPKLLLLDEPMSGLDPEARIELASLVKELARKGMTIMMSSDNLNDLKDFSTHSLKLHEGNFVAHEALGNYQPDHSQVLKILLSRASPKAEAILQAQAGVSNIKVSGDVCLITFKGKVAEQSALLFSLVHAGLPVAEIVVAKKNVQDRFLVDVDFTTLNTPRSDGLKPDEIAHIGAMEHPPTPID